MRSGSAAVTARDKIAEQIAAQQTAIARLEQQLQRVDKAVLAQRALDVAARMVPVSKEERAVARLVGEEIGKQMAKAGRSGGKRGEPSSRSPQQEPTLWERYQKRWPGQPEEGIRQIGAILHAKAVSVSATVVKPFGFATGDWEGSRCGIRTRIALQNPVA